MPHIIRRSLVGRAAQAFVAIEASSGIVLLLGAMAALVWVNSPWGDSYLEVWEAHLRFGIAGYDFDESLQHVVNDGLMTLFFFLVGLEIKRELVHGELSEPRKAALPVIAAVGGMVVPAGIYTGFNSGGGGSAGWGIPMATDIAFSLGVLALLSGRVPLSVKVFLLALAIVDDIGAVVVIALFYTSSLSYEALGIALALLGLVVVLQRIGVRSFAVYALVGVAAWLATFESGLHATLAGVALGLLTPATSATGSPPLERLEQTLHPWVSYAIVPLFALANAGVAIDAESIERAMTSSIAAGVVAGLVVGKPLGIFVATWLAVRLRVAVLPQGANWGHLAGVGLLAGIGFTVSLLITSLAFEDAAMIEDAKIGILFASVVAGLAGFVFLWLVESRQRMKTAGSED